MTDRTQDSTDRMDRTAGPVLFFDGVCNLCNGAVQFILDRERSPTLHFAPLQSDAAMEALRPIVGLAEAQKLREGATGSGAPDSMVLVDNGRIYTCSAGALRVTRHLRAPWRWAFAFVVIPRPLRDALYRFVARNRYRWFGREETCRVPTPQLRARFLA